MTSFGARPARPLNARGRPVVVAVVVALFVAGLQCPAGADEAVARVRLAIGPAWVSVHGHDVRVSEVLAALGAKAGFTIIGVGSERPVEHLSVEGPTIADVVRQLLRHEDHALVYREDTISASRPIDTIVLLGSRGGVPAPSTARGSGSGGVATPSDGIARTPAFSPAAGPEPRGQASAVARNTADGLEALLRTHARPGSEPDRVEDPVETGGGASGPDERSSTTVSSGGRVERAGPSADQGLAAATRKAQENLRTLIESLGAASRSMVQPLPSSR
jgi:hypothetical protein